MVRYIHGSEDSLDVDTYYVFPTMPSFQDCQSFCKTEGIENKNIITIDNGIVTDCYKGVVDEVNNGLIDTYALHLQEYPLLIERRLERDILIKDVRVIRCFLSYFSRTSLRTEVKSALRGGLSERIGVLEKLNIREVELLDKTFNTADILKVLAFQLGQSLALHEGIELYTKSSVADKYAELRPFLYRQPGALINLEVLKVYKDMFIEVLKSYAIREKGSQVYFVTEGKMIDMQKERYIEGV